MAPSSTSPSPPMALTLPALLPSTSMRVASSRCRTSPPDTSATLAVAAPPTDSTGPVSWLRSTVRSVLWASTAPSPALLAWATEISCKRPARLPTRPALPPVALTTASARLPSTTTRVSPSMTEPGFALIQPRPFRWTSCAGAPCAKAMASALAKAMRPGLARGTSTTCLASRFCVDVIASATCSPLFCASARAPVHRTALQAGQARPRRNCMRARRPASPRGLQPPRHAIS